MREILEGVETWMDEGKEVALATVVRTWGSGPRRAGAKMAISSEGEMSGSVSGGCVEGAVVEEGLECLRLQRTRLLDFGVSDDDAWSVGLTCGGELTVLLEPLQPAWWTVLASHARHDRGTLTATILDGRWSGRKVIVGQDGGRLYIDPNLDEELGADLIRLGGESYRRRQKGMVQVGSVPVFLDCQPPRPRLIVVGGAHVAVVLQHLARALDYRVIIIDPRSAFATPERFPLAEEIYHRYPEEVLPEIGLTSETYLAVLTHDPKIDDGALRLALQSSIPYVGVLSSRKTHEKRVSRLLEQGVPQASLERIRVPIGIELGGRRPEEIALAILAEIVSVRNGGSV